MPLARSVAYSASVSSSRVQADVEGERLRALVQPVEVPVEEHRMPAMDPQALPHAVAEHEPGVEHRHHRLRPGA